MDKDTVLFNIHGPMISAAFDAVCGVDGKERKYKVYTGKSGKRWLVSTGEAPEENIYVEGGPNSDGFGGRTIDFQIEDGTILSLKGPWKAHSTQLLADTGVDVRGLSWGCGIVSTHKKYGKWGEGDEFKGVIKYDPEPILPMPDYAAIAQEQANSLGQTVYFSYKTRYGGMSGHKEPQKKDK